MCKKCNYKVATSNVIQLVSHVLRCSSISSELISDEGYWERCCRKHWSLCDVSCYGKVWKRMFFERHAEELVERFVPEKSDLKEVSLYTRAANENPIYISLLESSSSKS